MRRSVVARELPIKKLTFPPALATQKNGRLDPVLLAPVKPFGNLYGKTAAIAWAEMKAAAKKDSVILKPTSGVDTYRPYNVQEALFAARYSTEEITGRPTRTCNGKTYWLLPGVASAACPGTSNHGWGLAVDIYAVGAEGRLEWLLDNAARFGWSWELQSEPWHIRYVLGDTLP